MYSIIFKYLHIVFVISLFVACSTNNDARYFNGKITIIDDSKIPIEKLTSKEIDFKYVATPEFAVYDSLIFFYNWADKDGFFSIHNVKNKEYLGHFCVRGNGHNESLGVANIYYFYKDGACLKTDQVAVNNNKLMVWNITKSLQNKTTVYDTIVPYDNGDGGGICNYYFRIGKDELFMYTPGVYTTIKKVKATLPKYTKRTIYSNKIEKEYNLFLESIESGIDESFGSDQYFSTYDCAKPDGSKIAQGMFHLSQLNILDLTTGEYNGYRLKGTYGFSAFNKDTPHKHGYVNVQTDDNFIYAFYYYDESKANQVHVFDWNGNIIRKLELDQDICRMSLDRVNNILYITKTTGEKVYCYDLNNI